MTIRGCAYAGSKGVVWGPIKDMIHISHGPVGCGQYSRAGRRNYYVGTTGVNTFGTMNFTSDFQEKDIVFGGDKKLAKLIDEVEGAVPAQQGHLGPVRVPDRPDRRRHRSGRQEEGEGARQADRAGPLRRFPRRLAVAGPPHRQRLDPRLHHADKACDKPIGYEESPYDVAIIGDYNIGGDAWSSRTLLEEMGLRVVAQWTGDGTLAEIEHTPKVKLNLIHCYRSMNYIARHMEEKYGIPWIEYNFFGPTKIAESLRADRRALRRHDQGRGRAGHRQVPARDARRSSPSTGRAWKARR